MVPVKKIEMLIGADIYWKLINNDIKKDDNSGMIAKIRRLVG